MFRTKLINPTCSGRNYSPLSFSQVISTSPPRVGNNGELDLRISGQIIKITLHLVFAPCCTYIHYNVHCTLYIVLNFNYWESKIIKKIFYRNLLGSIFICNRPSQGCMRKYIFKGFILLKNGKNKLNFGGKQLIFWGKWINFWRESLKNENGCLLMS